LRKITDSCVDPIPKGAYTSIHGGYIGPRTSLPKTYQTDLNAAASQQRSTAIALARIPAVRASSANHDFIYNFMEVGIALFKANNVHLDLLQGIRNGAVFARIAHTNHGDFFAIGGRAVVEIQRLQRNILNEFLQLNQHDIILICSFVVVWVRQLFCDTHQPTVHAVQKQTPNDDSIQKGSLAVRSCDKNVIVNQGSPTEFLAGGEGKGGKGTRCRRRPTHDARFGGNA
jgi:hypothetical protein